MLEGRDYLKRINAVHEDAVRRLASIKGPELDELAVLFEDIGNRYLDLADEICARIRAESASTG